MEDNIIKPLSTIVVTYKASQTAEFIMLELPITQPVIYTAFELSLSCFLMDISFFISFIRCLNIPFCLLTNDTLEDPHQIFFAKKTKTFIHSNTVQDMILQANLKLKNKIPY